MNHRLFWILLLGVTCCGLDRASAQDRFGLQDPDRFAADTLFRRLKSSDDLAQARRIIESTDDYRLALYSLTLNQWQSLPSHARLAGLEYTPENSRFVRLIKSVTRDEARYLLTHRYGLSDQKINTLYESESLWTLRYSPFRLGWAWLPIALAATASSAYVVFNAAPPYHLPLGVRAAYVSGIGLLSLISAGAAEVFGYRGHQEAIYKETRVSIPDLSIVSVRKLVEACSRQ